MGEVYEVKSTFGEWDWQNISPTNWAGVCRVKTLSWVKEGRVLVRSGDLDIGSTLHIESAHGEMGAGAISVV